MPGIDKYWKIFEAFNLVVVALSLAPVAVAYLPVGFALQAGTWVFFRQMDILNSGVE